MIWRQRTGKQPHKEISSIILVIEDVLEQRFLKKHNYLDMEFAEMECENFAKILKMWVSVLEILSMCDFCLHQV